MASLSDVYCILYYWRPVVPPPGLVLYSVHWLQAIGGECPRAVVDNVCDVLQSLNKHYSDYSRKWLSDQIMIDGFPNAMVSSQEKETFVRLVLRSVSVQYTIVRINANKSAEAGFYHISNFRGYCIFFAVIINQCDNL